MGILRIKLLLLLLIPLTAFAESVHIINDSPFPLIAKILAADGTEHGTAHLNQGHQVTWHDNYRGASQFSTTPYTIIFTCKSGKEYGISTNVGPGQTVTAESSSGPRICEIEKKGSNKAQGS